MTQMDTKRVEDYTERERGMKRSGEPWLAFSILIFQQKAIVLIA